MVIFVSKKNLLLFPQGFKLFIFHLVLIFLVKFSMIFGEQLTINSKVTGIQMKTFLKTLEKKDLRR